jgi:hypothetical protein
LDLKLIFLPTGLSSLPPSRPPFLPKELCSRKENIPNSRGSCKFSAPILQFEKKKKKKHKQSPKPMCRLLPNSNVCKKAKKHVNQIYTCNFSTPSTTMTRRKRNTSGARNNQSSPNLNVCTQAKKHAKFEAGKNF